MLPPASCSLPRGERRKQVPGGRAGGTCRTAFPGSRRLLHMLSCLGTLGLLLALWESREGRASGEPQASQVRDGNLLPRDRGWYESNDQRCLDPECPGQGRSRLAAIAHGHRVWERHLEAKQGTHRHCHGDERVVGCVYSRPRPRGLLNTHSSFQAAAASVTSVPGERMPRLL